MTAIRLIEPSSDSSSLHVGVVAASWNPTITDRLLEGALERLRELGVGQVTVLKVPGSLELPIGADTLLEKGCDAVVALGAIVKGDTDHYDIVVRESTRGLTLVSTRRGAPVANGVLAVHDISHAVDRSRPGPANKGEEAASAAVATAMAIQAARGSATSK